MTKRKLAGPAFRSEVLRAMNANLAARRALARIIDERPATQALALLLAKATTELALNLEALREIERIIENAPGASEGK